jgi:hypothetical protein
MPTKPPPATSAEQQYDRIDLALRLLCNARDQLATAGAPRTLARVRLAISSAKGARRAAGGRWHREERRRLQAAGLEAR